MTNHDEGMKTMTVKLTKDEDSEFLKWSRNFNRAQTEARIARTERVELTGRTYRSEIVPTGRARLDLAGIPPLLHY